MNDYENFDYEFTMKLYYIVAYNNHNPIMHTNDFYFFELHYSLVKSQLIKFYKYYLIKNKYINNLVLLYLVNKKECKEEINNTLDCLEVYNIMKKQNYDDINEEYIQFFYFLPKITTNVKKSKRNVEFLDDK